MAFSTEIAFRYTLTWLVVLGAALMIGLFTYLLGILGAIMILALPFAVGAIWLIFMYPMAGLYLALIMGFLSSGLGRYLPAPWGLTIDIFLFLTLIVVTLNRSLKVNWHMFSKDLVILGLIWFLYLVLEIFNPESLGLEPWFYAMRGIGFYQAMSFMLLYLLIREKGAYNTFIDTILIISMVGSLWGLKQQILGTDAAENHWLYAEHHHEEHILHGVLRVFSFYSDAGQFGASQAMMALLSGILFLGPFSAKRKMFYFASFLLTFIGFAISGTRGALAVPAAGGIAYLVVSKNFKILITGMLAIGLVFYILKFTFAFQGVEQVRRMRSALDPENPSLQVRLDNQKTFNHYLSDKPMGGGIGSAGFWGARFAPDSILANTATDSWYVKIWAETGLIGISLHLFILGFILGKGGRIVWNLQDLKLKYLAMGLYASVAGVLLSSYGNQVFGQMPTGMIMNFAIPLVFLAPYFDSKN
ncbi:MAG: O-antigen ligase family protein [Candidatus Cyclobacteriaceae bacterium M3_2C_046]